MDFNGRHNELSMIADTRPPNYNFRNIPSGFGQVYGGDENESDSDAHHQHTQALLEDIVQHHAMTDDAVSVEESSTDGDEGLEDHLRSDHVEIADLGHFHVGEVRRLLAYHCPHHHHHCDCHICPYRVDAFVNEWLNTGIEPDTPGSMYPEHPSENTSMTSSMVVETRPQTPSPLLAGMGTWEEDETMPFPQVYSFVRPPLHLVPHQLEPCIPEESEPTSDNEV